MKSQKVIKIQSGIVAQNEFSESSNAKIPLLRKMRPYLILTPALILTVGILIPFVVAIYYSFTDYSLKYQGYSFIGFQNWIAMFTDERFWHSFWVTAKYTFYCTIVEAILGIIVALLLNNENLISNVLRIALMIPLMISPVIATIIWQLMTNNSVGIYSRWLRAIGINFQWGANPSTAMFSVVLIDTWVYTSFIMILVLAGLKSLPKSPFEAAMLDGGSAWFQFRKLTLPMTMPFILIAALFRLMVSSQEFSVIYALTRGGPGDTLMTLPLTGYIMAFTYKDLGGAVTYMLILWLCIYILSFYIIKWWTNAQKRASGI